MEKIFHTNRSKNKARVATLISDKIVFKTKKNAERNSERHYIMIRGPIHKEDITIVNTYIPSTGAPKYLKQIFINIM